MKDSYKKYTAYNIAIFLIMSATVISYYKLEKYYLFTIGIIITFILIYKQNQLVRLEGIDPDSLVSKTLATAFVILDVISGLYLNRYVWAVVLLISIFAIQLYLLNKAFKKRLEEGN